MVIDFLHSKPPVKTFIAFIQYKFPAWLVIISLCILLMACGEQNRQHNVLENYRVMIAGKECTFDLQMLYLITVLELYRLHVGTYPSVENNLDALIHQPAVLEATGEWRGPYVDSITAILDPWGNQFYYAIDERGKIDLRSLGPDGMVSEDDISAQEQYPNWYREMEKLSQFGPIPVQPKSATQ